MYMYIYIYIFCIYIYICIYIYLYKKMVEKMEEKILDVYWKGITVDRNSYFGCFGGIFRGFYYALCPP